MPLKKTAREGGLASEWPYSALIADGPLRPMGQRPSLGSYLRQTWRRRHFIWFDARSRVLTRNSAHRLGSFWLFGKPLLDAIFYFLIFGVVLGVSRGMENFPAYIVVGVLTFQFTANVLNQSASVMRQQRPVIRAFPFPRVSVVLSLLVRESLTMGPVLLGAVLVILALPPHEWPSWSWLLVPAVLMLHALFNLGLAMFVARVAVVVPDLAVGMGFAVRVLMYGSGVIFPIERFVHHPVVYGVLTHNPVFLLLQAYRDLLIVHQLPSAQTWGEIAAWAVGLCILGLVFFWRGEESYGRL